MFYFETKQESLLTYDIDRFLYKIKISAKQEEIDGKHVTGKHLVIPISGVSAVEEMAFSQLMLASYISIL